MEFNLLFLWFFRTTTSHKIPIGQKKNRTVFEHSRFIFTATLSVDRNTIKLFQFVMNKDWLLFFYPGKNLYFSIYSYSKPYLCLTVEKNGIKC